jgi:hypothetical protein
MGSSCCDGLCCVRGAEACTAPCAALVSDRVGSRSVSSMRRSDKSAMTASGAAAVVVTVKSQRTGDALVDAMPGTSRSLERPSVC